MAKGDLLAKIIQIAGKIEHFCRKIENTALLFCQKN